MNQRTIQSKQILQTKENIIQLDISNFKVKSQTKDKFYTVSRTGNGLVCTCLDHTKGKADCKHLKSILEIIKKNKNNNHGFRIMERSQLQLCKFCDSGNLKKNGMRQTKLDKVQRFKCLECNKRFTTNFGFENRQYNEAIITGTLQMYYSGMSVRDIANHYEIMGIEISHMAVYKWIDKYSKMTSEYLKGIVPRVSETWHTDEIYIKVRGKKKLQYTMLDHVSRYMITKYVANTKYTEDVKPMFKEAMMIADKKPTTLISDGAANFHEAWKDEYRAKNDLQKNTKHIRHIYMNGDKNNNRMERLNGTIRDREVAYRGIKKMTSPLFDGFQVYYNFTKKHGSLYGCTPAEYAKIKVEGKNK